MFHDHDRETGFTLVEVLFALLILTLVITTSLAIFFEREKRLRFAEETIVAWQAIANEAEILRHTPFRELGAGSEDAFSSDLSILAGLDGADATYSVAEAAPGVKTVTLRISWLNGQRQVETSIVRTDTGGGSLW